MDAMSINLFFDRHNWRDSPKAGRHANTEGQGYR